ncbi:unnamed protein product, partial [Ectocarpus sp. 13 AM-2016]
IERAACASLAIASLTLVSNETMCTILDHIPALADFLPLALWTRRMNVCQLQLQQSTHGSFWNAQWAFRHHFASKSQSKQLPTTSIERAACPSLQVGLLMLV